MYLEVVPAVGGDPRTERVAMRLRPVLYLMLTVALLACDRSGSSPTSSGGEPNPTPGDPTDSPAPGLRAG